MKNLATAASALLLLLSPTLSAQPAEQEKLKDKLALDILIQNGGKKSGELMIDRIFAQVPPAARDQLRKRIDVDELMVRLAVVYSKRFSGEELQDILDYYKTPSGKAIAGKRPAMLALSMAAGQQYMQRKMAGQPVELPKPGPGEEDPLKIAIALTEASGEAATTAETIDLMLDSLKKTNPQLARRMGELIVPADMNLLGAKAMADSFTVKEMQAMIDFFKTTTGKKLAKHMSAITRESGKASEDYFKAKLQPNR